MCKKLFHISLHAANFFVHAVVKVYIYKKPYIVDVTLYKELTF